MTSIEYNYIKAARKAPYLDKKTEIDLARKWYYHKNEKALAVLTSAYLRRALALVARFRHFGLPYIELIQEASLGIMIAASRFNPERGVRFSTYADWWIRAKLQDYVFRHWSIVRVGSTSAHKSLFFNLRRLRNKFDKEGKPYLDQKTGEKIAQELNVKTKDVLHMAKRLETTHLSLNTPITEGAQESWQDQIEALTPSPEQEVIERLDKPKESEVLRKAIHHLNPREHFILKHRYLYEKKTTLEKLGKKMEISKERVRQLEQRALAKLKEILQLDPKIKNILKKV